jgi:hypothetical protein
MQYYTIKDTQADKVFTMSLVELVSILNEDHGPDFIPYTGDDWREGWAHFGIDGWEIVGEARK